MDFTFGIITGGSQNHREDTEENLVVERIKKIICCKFFFYKFIKNNHIKINR